MKITIYALTQIVPIFQKVLTLSFPAKQAFALTRLINKLDAETVVFNTFRQETVMKFAKRDEKGNPVIENGLIVIPDEKKEQFQQEMLDLLNSEIEIAAEPIPSEWLENDNLSLSPQEINLIMPLLKE